MAEKEKKQTIFIVEDEVDLGEMLAAYFRVQGYHVITTTHGLEAVKRIAATMPDIVVLDIRLPDIDGYEVCRRLRQGRRTQNIPILFLTEKRDTKDKMSGLEMGAVDYITKPFDIQELRLRVRNVLARTQLSWLFNPVTTLPEEALVREQLDKAFSKPNWGVVHIHLHGLDKFREKYGFVAADDVARAVALMISNTSQDLGNEGDFVGHASATDYLVVTTADRCRKLADRCRLRLQPAIQYFYPALERQRLKEWLESERLSVVVEGMTRRDFEPDDVLKQVFAVSEQG